MDGSFTLNFFLSKYGLSFTATQKRELGSSIARRLRNTSKFKGVRLPKVRDSFWENGKLIKCKVTSYPLSAEKYIQDETLKYLTRIEHEKTRNTGRKPPFSRRYKP